MNTDIATVVLTGSEETTSTTYTATQVTSATSGSAYYVGNGSSFLVFDGSTLSTTTDISEATAFTWTATNAQGGTVYRLAVTSGGTTYYLVYEGSTWSVTTSTGQGKDGPANFSGSTSVTVY